MESSRNLTIISDDLTGAVDSSAFSLTAGADVRVELRSDAPIRAHRPGELIAVNMSSRTIPGEEAEALHRSIGGRIATLPRQIVMKKMDTGFRGNAAFEIRGLMEGLGSPVCFVIDHSPMRGTFTLYGKQYVDGVILSKSVFAKEDPLKRPVADSIPEILAAQGDCEVGLVDIDTVKGGDIKAAVEAIASRGVRFIVFDAVTDADTLRILKTLIPSCPGALWAGSSGLAAGLAACLYGDPRESVYTVDPTLKSACFTASAYQKVRTQIACAKERGLQEVFLDIERLVRGDKSALDEAVTACLNINKTGSFILSPKVPECIVDAGLPAFILTSMTACAVRICEKAVFDRIVVIGGETSYSILSGLEITRLRVMEKPETGIGTGLIEDGPYRGKSFSIKGGSIASEQALCEMMGLERRALCGAESTAML